MAAPIQQIYLAIKMIASINAVRYWFNGAPLPTVQRGPAPTGGVKYWFNGAPVQTIKGS